MSQQIQSGWIRIASGLDVKLHQGIPVKITCSNAGQHLDDYQITQKVYQLTGLTISVKDWAKVTADERESAVCIDRKEFDLVLKRLALSSAAIYVDRFHRAIGSHTVDWNDAEYTFDFNHAIEHCCLPWGTLNKKDYYPHYLEIMRDETERLISKGISPMVEAE